MPELPFKPRPTVPSAPRPGDSPLTQPRPQIDGTKSFSSANLLGALKPQQPAPSTATGAKDAVVSRPSAGTVKL